MKKLSQILMASGGIITVLGSMCDADGIYFNYLIAAMFAGLLLVAIGMILYWVWEAREEARRRDIMRMRRRARDERADRKRA
nr:MAG TPA: holin [Caudoviricetes sp.]